MRKIYCAFSVDMTSRHWNMSFRAMWESDNNLIKGMSLRSLSNEVSIQSLRSIANVIEILQDNRFCVESRICWQYV